MLLHTLYLCSEEDEKDSLENETLDFDEPIISVKTKFGDQPTSCAQCIKLTTGTENA
jgi:hypothetical protein